MAFDYMPYIRQEKMPHMWCPGCGIGTVMKSMIRSFSELEWAPEDIAVVSGIGCTSRLPGYLNVNTLHTTHGRAISFATGIKMHRQDKHVVVISGDGDGSAIGGNHLIHAARRNIDITVIINNNNIYGMTGGQGSPTTPDAAFSTTTPYGNAEKHFDVCDLAKAAGATYVGRSTVYHAPQLEKQIATALEHRGFALVEAIANCHTYFGRLNRQGDAVAMLNMFKERSVTTAKAKEMTEEELKDKWVIGTLYESTEKSEFCEEYQKLVDRVAKGGR